jgi:hypothetical protein
MDEIKLSLCNIFSVSCPKTTSSKEQCALGSKGHKLPWGNGIRLPYGGNHVSLGSKKFKLPWGTTMFLGEQGD